MKRHAARRYDFAIDLSVRALLATARALPYRWRVPLIGWVTSRIVSPLAGWPQRIRANLDHVMPEMPEAERRRLIREVPDNAGRTLAEIYSGARFARQLAGTPIEGPGLAALDAARDAGQPAVLVTAHFGNFVAPRVVMLARGYDLGGLYRPMRNRHFNRHYEAALAAIGEPMFPSGRQGLGRLLRHLRDGGMIGILTDIYIKGGPTLSFIGKPAPTAYSAAELALRHEAPLVPVYAVRQPDGLNFRMLAEAPIPPSDAHTMTQALNDSLEAQVRRHPEQWFWIHRRWKPERQRKRQRKRAAARIGP
ncbi:lysophospholipid acyltransferase family protein [Roseitranquillus sediminis]|uniref:lysophospholipid acyltransferase family protein n=1 Tax=Roseitranquillus sediminis TaxID=2809051 RepID=UPI001D0C8809|nr:lauroyl acyltransferase [Roseitranquillus sediminis]MBM9595237.1 lauroyl acyltransferase [Roseitranquillus sediminis]